MSARDRILRRDEGASDPPIDSIDRLREFRRNWGTIKREPLPISRDVHLECRAAAASLNAAYAETVRRQQHTIDVQTAYITKLHAEVDQARMLSGLPPKYAAAPALMSKEEKSHA